MEGRSARIQRWLDRGLALERAPRPDGPALALRCYRRAAAALARLPEVDTPEVQRALARAEVNVGNATPALTESLAAYDSALARLATVDLAKENSALRGTAWLNRGARLLRASSARHVEARASFDEAIAAFTAAPADRFVQRNLAAAWMNRAAANALSGEHAQVAAEAEQSLTLVAALESDDVAAAEIGLKARLLWLAQPPTDAIALADWIGPASDCLDQGLALAQAWTSRGFAGLLRPAEALFRVGCAFHLRHLPKFLPEFLREYLLSWPEATFAAHFFANECAARARSALHLRLLTEPSSGAANLLEELADTVDALTHRQVAQFGDDADLVWLQARQHELAGRSEAARLAWHRYLRQRPEDRRARRAATDWPTHRGAEGAALAFAAEAG
ncbi:MAG: hypothetical protein JSR82_11740 [Verrucomicrobia bacterium]|nr:hypothetical protein [Verrucomicrobiota bacterium]